jgi:hypothetical protein
VAGAVVNAGMNLTVAEDLLAYEEGVYSLELVR